MGQGKPTSFLLAGHSQHARLELSLAFTGGGHQGHHGATQLLRQALCIQMDAPLARHIHHVQRQNHGNSHLQQLNGEIQVTLQVCRIHHVDDQIRFPGQQVVPGDFLIQRRCIQGIYPRQVNQLYFMLIDLEPAFLAIYSNAWPVAGALTNTGQRIE